MPLDLPVMAPQPEESLSVYVRRLRTHLKFTQAEIGEKAGLNRHTIGKIETGLTQRLNSKALSGLSEALGVPPNYLEGVCKGTPLTGVGALKFCPQCWNPGKALDPMWVELRSKYCFACGTALRDRCTRCQEPIMTLRHRFCGFCGLPYKDV